METELLYGAIAGLFATLVTVFYKYIIFLQERIAKADAYQEKLAPILEKQQNMLERALEELGREKERRR